MGPGGRLVALRRGYGYVTTTKDGVTVAREIALHDNLQDVGAKLCIQVASKCNDEAGDGTTTATVLAQNLIKYAMRVVDGGGNPVKVKHGMNLAAAKVLEYITNIKKDISLEDEEDVKFIATVSGNDEEVGAVTAEAFIKAGEMGVVQEELTKNPETKVSVVEGTQFDRGYMNRYFVNEPEHNRCVLEDKDGVMILLWEDGIKDMQDCVKFLEELLQNGRPLLIVSDTIEQGPLDTIITNLKHIYMPREDGEVRPGSLRCVCVHAPGWADRRKDLMQDLAVITGGTFYSSALGLKLNNVPFTTLGTAKKVVVTANQTVIYDGGGKPEDIAAHVENLRRLYKEVKDSPDDADKVRERLGKLTGGIAVIKIGATNETELGEKRYRYQDAVCATKAALEEGVVPGGGTTLAGASLALQTLVDQERDADIRAGIQAVQIAMAVPCQLIAENAGYSGPEILGELKRELAANPFYGFNARSGEYHNLYEEGIIDPAKVTRLAVQNSVSIAGLVLLSNGIIADAPETSQSSPPSNPYAGLM